MPHLSAEDIAAPPHQWFDAMLARQIALHISVHEFGVSRKRLSRDLRRNRASIMNALRTVDDRLLSPDFARAYADMAARARKVLRKAKEKA